MKLAQTDYVTIALGRTCRRLAKSRVDAEPLDGCAQAVEVLPHEEYEEDHPPGEVNIRLVIRGRGGAEVGSEPANDRLLPLYSR